jgi:class 3 adenylate cyclase
MPRGRRSASSKGSRQAPTKAAAVTAAPRLLSPDYAARLAQSQLVEGLTPKDIEQFIGHVDARPHRYPDGAAICQCGGSADCMWIVLSGRVDSRLNGNTIASRVPYELIGEQAAIDGEGRSTELVAAGQTEVLTIPFGPFQSLAPELGVKIWRNIAKIESSKLRQASQTRSDQNDRDRHSQKLIGAFLNEHQIEIALAQGSFDADHPHLGVERGQYIIIFTDLVGFSRLAAGKPDDETAALIRACMEAQSAAFEHHGILIDKFMGDGLMGYARILQVTTAGTQAACERALSGAMAAREAIRAIAIDGQQLSLRLGLHLGAALAGNFGAQLRMQVTLIGEEINYAARLEQARESDHREGDERLGDVRVSEAFFSKLTPASQQSLPHRTLIRAKQADIWVQSGPAPQR